MVLSISLANGSAFWFLRGMMTRQKLTGRQIMVWRRGIGKPRRWLAEPLDVSPKTVESCDYESGASAVHPAAPLIS